VKKCIGAPGSEVLLRWGCAVIVPWQKRARGEVQQFAVLLAMESLHLPVLP